MPHPQTLLLILLCIYAVLLILTIRTAIRQKNFERCGLQIFQYTAATIFLAYVTELFKLPFLPTQPAVFFKAYTLEYKLVFSILCFDILLSSILLYKKAKRYSD